MSTPSLSLGADLPGALRKLNPRTLVCNPVMFIVEVGAAVSTALAIAQSLGLKDTSSSPSSLLFGWSIAGLFGKLPGSKQTGLSVALILAIFYLYGSYFIDWIAKHVREA